jgi:hypothetical protein
MAMGLVLATGLARDGGGGRAATESAELDRVSTWQLSAVVARRAMGWVTRRVRLVRRLVMVGKGDA